MLTQAQAKYFRERNWGHAATIRPDGTPHVTPVWVDWDGECVLFNTTVGNTKHRHLLRDPRVTVETCFQDEPGRGAVTVTGRAELIEEGAIEHLDRLTMKYRGLETYPWLEPGERRVIVRVHPERVSASGEAAS